MCHKVLICCSCYFPDVKGGGELSTKFLAEALVEAGCKVVVATVSTEDREEEINGVKIYRLKNTNLYWSFNKESYGAGSKLAWHIIDSYNWYMAKKVLSVAALEECKIIITSTIEDISSATWVLAKKEGITTYHILRSYSLLCTNANMFKNGNNCRGQCVSCKLLTFLKKEASIKSLKVIRIRLCPVL